MRGILIALALVAGTLIFTSPAAAYCGTNEQCEESCAQRPCTCPEGFHCQGSGAECDLQTGVCTCYNLGCIPDGGFIGPCRYDADCGKPGVLCCKYFACIECDEGFPSVSVPAGGDEWEQAEAWLLAPDSGCDLD